MITTTVKSVKFDLRIRVVHQLDIIFASIEWMKQKRKKSKIRLKQQMIPPSIVHFVIVVC